MLTHGIYLLDTDVCIALIKGQHGIQERIRDIDPMEIKISDITLAELYFGAYKSGREKHFDDVRKIYGLFESYPIQHLRKYGELRWMLEQKGMKIGDMDMFIAATALEEDLILVTGNTDHFYRIPDLKIENWIK